MSPGLSSRPHDPPLDCLLHLPPLPVCDSQFDTDHPAPKGTGVPTMTDEWASELAAWNVANERARQEFDAWDSICGKRKPANVLRLPLQYVYRVYDRAFSACHERRAV